MNRLREGNQDEEDFKTLKEQILQNESNITRNLPHLFTRRCDVQQYNKEIFSHINESNKTIVEAFDSVSGDLPSSMCEKVLSKLPDDASKTKGLTKFLCLGEAMPAKICINIDVADGMTNGTPCTIKKLDYRVPNSTRCSIVWVEFCSSDIGKKCKNSFNIYMKDTFRCHGLQF